MRTHRVIRNVPKLIFILIIMGQEDVNILRSVNTKIAKPYLRNSTHSISILDWYVWDDKTKANSIEA